MQRCTCGRPVNAGRTAGTQGNTRCLICQTAELMRTLPEPVKKATKKSRA